MYDRRNASRVATPNFGFAGELNYNLKTAEPRNFRNATAFLVAPKSSPS